MLVIIPVSNTDEKLITDFSSVLNFFGSCEKHELLVVSRPSDAAHAIRLLNNIKHLFKNYDVYSFETDGTRGWPQGPNYYWQQTILHLNNERLNKLPWLWMELDMTPLKYGWLDALELEYKKRGKLCMGWTQDTTTITTDRIVVPLTKHLVGAAIYPPDITVCCDIWKHVDRINTAFDVLCQWQLVPNSHHTELFQHCFRTQNYKIVETPFNCIKGEDHNDFPDNLRFDFPINPNAVLHHGCDDGSLARLLVEITPEKVVKKKITSTKKK